MIENIPLPATQDPIDAPFWQATLRSQLLVQRCEACMKLRFPPRAMCPYCNGVVHRWHLMSGRGKIWSFAAPQPPLLPAFAALTPYVTAVVELEEHPQLRMVGALVGRDTGSIRGMTAAHISIDDPVRVVFVKHTDDVALPCWQLTRTS